MKEWLGEITNRPGYDPAKHELAPYLEEQVAAETVLPSMYRYGDGTMLGEMLQAIGATIKALDVRSGQSVLEYGAGDGAICLNLARMGCRVTAVDIENRYLKLIQAQALALGTSVHTINAPFGSAEPDYLYDRILFFEAFHHALAHQELLRSLRRQLAPGGFIVFAGEPILPIGSYFRPTLPYAWGPRLDGLSVRAMRSYGWCELGFTREYFVDLLMRSGFAVTYRPDPSTERGSAYVAIRTGRIVDFGGPHLLETTHIPDCWHPGEGRFAGADPGLLASRLMAYPDGVRSRFTFTTSSLSRSNSICVSRRLMSTAASLQASLRQSRCRSRPIADRWN